MSSTDPTTRRIAIWGATGATGKDLLRQCLDDPRISQITAFTRRSTGKIDPKLTEVIVDDFLDPSPHIEKFRDIDAAFWCLGVSQTQVPEEDRYREITQAYTLAAAKALKHESPDVTFHFISGMSADPSGKSRMMWARIKGATEQDLAELNLRRLLIWRPAFILATGGREKPSLADKLSRFVTPLLRLIPNLTNTTENIARAMLNVTFDRDGSGTFESKDINRLS